MAELLTGRVVGITDGDAIAVLGEKRYLHKVRVAGIHAPEKKMPFGQRSRESLSRLVFDKQVAVDWHKHDRDQRIVGKVMVADTNCTAATCPKTLDAGIAQITTGLAWWYRKYANEQPTEDRGRYDFAEQEERAKRIGLWSDPNPNAPWNWRKEKRDGG